nr:hypothetical protein [Thermococcus sp. Bubb.Bath]
MKAWLIIGLLVGALVPVGAVMASGSGNAAIPGEDQGFNTTNTTEMQIVAEHIISNLEKLHNITSRIMEEVNFTANSTIVENYQMAEEYREAALEAYGSGNYKGAIANGVLAMHHYRVVLERVKDVRNKIRDELPAEVKRIKGYFMAAEKTIKRAQEEGIDVGNATELLNQTEEAYKQVMEDIKEKNIGKAQEDLVMARELKRQLDEKLVKIRKELAYANADKIVNAFLKRGENAMEFAQRIIDRVNASGGNATELQERLNEFQEVYGQVKKLADRGNYTGALDVIIANRGTIGKFHRAIEFAKRRIHERKVGEKMKDMKKLVREFHERIGKDGRALEELHRKGVDTRGPQLKLKTAAQEVHVGVELLKRGREAEAKAHFTIALNLLEDVESFIVKHA